jgi:glycosyltransferase involved in cell wall biosynthesis
MSGKTLVSVVIPTYQRTEMLRRGILSLFDQTLAKDQYEVIVVDSSPDDSNEKMLAEVSVQAPCRFRFFRKKAEGPGPSRNLGAAKAEGGIIAFMDSDCFASPGWLSAGLAAFSQGVGIVQGRTLPNPAQKSTGFIQSIHVEKETHLYETANIFYSRKAFEETAGFRADAHFNRTKPLGGEDTELAWIVKRRGWQSRFAEEALVYHEVFQITPFRWIFIDRLSLFPGLVGSFPELRQFMCARYFWDLGQALFTLLLLGAVGAFFSLWFLLLALPYVVYRASGSARTLRGPLRVLRVLLYVARDVCSFGILLTASVRDRCLLL